MYHSGLNIISDRNVLLLLEDFTGTRLEPVSNKHFNSMQQVMIFWQLFLLKYNKRKVRGCILFLKISSVSSVGVWNSFLYSVSLRFYLSCIVLKSLEKTNDMDVVSLHLYQNFTCWKQFYLVSLLGTPWEKFQHTLQMLKVSTIIYPSYFQYLQGKSKV